MGNSINKIDEGFYICSCQALFPTSRLRELGICCVLNAAEADLYTPKLAEELKAFDVKILGAQDAQKCNLSRHFAEIADFIEAGRAKGGVVVHCAAGISRASTSACAYLMIKEHWSLDAAFSRVYGVRSVCRPIAGFWRQLRDLEASLIYQGIELRSLPPDWQFLEQPAGSEDDATPPDGRKETVEERLEVLEKQAESQASFVTQYLTAVLTPVEGQDPKALAQEVLKSCCGGITWDTVLPEAGHVSLRAGLVPSLDAATLQSILAKVPGVERARVEGVST